MILLICGLLTLGLYATALTIPDWSQDFTRFGGLFAGLLAVYAGAVVAVVRGRVRVTPVNLAVLWVGSVLFRALVLASPPTLSDDLYRYIWDGRVLLAGIHPYRFAPDDPSLIALRDALWSKINHPDLPTIYPPLLMLVFAASAAVAPSVLGWKATAVLFDLAAGYQLMRALQARGDSPLWALLYLWHPLVIVEFAGSGHADAVGLFLVCAAFRYWTERRAWISGVALTLAGLVKFLPWAALPRLLPELRWRWLVLPVLAAVFYLPFALGDVSALGSLGAFAKTWRGNDLVFGWILQEPVTEASLALAKKWCAVIVLGVWLLAMASRRSLPSVYGWVVGVALLVSPVVHPWYVIWLLPAAILVRQPAWWVWSLTVILAYHPYVGVAAGGAWEERMAFKLVEYLPVLALLVVQPWAERRERLRG